MYRLSISSRILLAAQLFLLIPTIVIAQYPADRGSPAIKVSVPREGERFLNTTFSTGVTFTVTGKSPLVRVTAEVIGETTGVFFTICEGQDDRNLCTGDLLSYNFDLTVPVFAGNNTLKIIATDKSQKTSEITRRFFMMHFITDQRDEVLQSLERTPVSVTAAEEKDVPYTPSMRDEDRYDLLIITQSKKKTVGNIQYLEGFGKILLPLVMHKNKTGMPTIMLTLGDLYREPEYRGRDHAEIIKNAIAKARSMWGIKYVMLVGDCDKFPVRYTKSYDLGHWGHSYAPSDLYYADLFDSTGTFQTWDYDGDDRFGEMQGNFAKNADDLNQDRLDLVPDVAVGRVPASTENELRTYVKKVIQYETTASASWFKRALLMTGDYPWSNATNDYIDTQLQMRSFSNVKLYHDQIWPTTNSSQRRQLIETEVNNGVGFISYVGHGWGVPSGATVGGGWGGWYDYTAIPFLNNAARLPVIFSAACSTAMFHAGNGPYFAKWGYKYTGAPYSETRLAKYKWGPEPIGLSPTAYDVDALAEHFLVKNTVGGIAFIGSYTGTQGDSHTLAKFFFEKYAAGADILGDAWNGAISKFVSNVINGLAFPGTSWYTAAQYHHIHKMLLFGDPSLRLGGVHSDLVAIPSRAGNFCTIRDGRLVVTVRNQGGGSAGPSTTLVDFGSHGQFTQPTSSLNAGQQVELHFELPAGCFDSDCGFSITIDVGLEVEESDEGNNFSTGNCVG